MRCHTDSRSLAISFKVDSHFAHRSGIFLFVRKLLGENKKISDNDDEVK